MDRPYDTYIIVKMPDGSTYEADTNLLDLKREFYCPICSTLGEDAKITLQSISDHMSRHYIENNRAGKIAAAIAEDIRPVKVSAADYDRAVENVLAMPGPRVVQGHSLPTHSLTEEEMIEIAMAESMKDAQTAQPAEPVPATAQVAKPAEPVPTSDVPIYPPRRKKGQ